MSNGPNAQSPTSPGGGLASHVGPGGQGQPVQLSKPKLAEYRYGREEMLALYMSEDKPPAGASKFSGLFRDKPIDPISQSAVTEEEQVGGTVALSPTHMYTSCL